MTINQKPKMKPFQTRPIMKGECTHCQKAIEFHNFSAHFGGDKDIPIFCYCGEVLVSHWENKRFCSYCGKLQYYLTLRCPIDLAINGKFPMSIVNDIFYTIIGKRFGHVEYRGYLQTKFNKNAQSK